MPDLILRQIICTVPLLLPFLLTYSGKTQSNPHQDYFKWATIDSLPSFGTQEDQLGVAGPIAGTHQGALVVAGGANFSKPVWENEKEWHDDIWVLTHENQPAGPWINAGSLLHSLAYSAVVSTDRGIIAMG
ncbi:MAG: hypothetical protein OEQ53_04705, partial [Saprospiraceae bacterium]|nr:hypothetical protein [Saprospiraceae bacterium]